MIQTGRAKPTHLNTERGVKKKPGCRRDRAKLARDTAERVPVERYVVELGCGMWIGNWFGYPGKTMLLKNAKRFSAVGDAIDAMVEAKRLGSFPEANIGTVIE